MYLQLSASDREGKELYTFNEISGSFADAFVATKLHEINEKSGRPAVGFVATILFHLMRCQICLWQKNSTKTKGPFFLAMLLEGKTVISDKNTGHVPAMFVATKLVF